jgi:tetratricopeptide (TPR) repeat protein
VSLPRAYRAAKKAGSLYDSQVSPDPSVQTEATADGHMRSHLHVIVEALIPLHLLPGDHAQARVHVTTLLDHAAINGFQIWHACAACHDAILSAGEPDADSALRRLDAAVDHLRETGCCTHLTMFLGMQAALQIGGGGLADAATTIESALDWCELHGEDWFLPELLRIEGELLRSQGRCEAASEAFHRALDMSRHQGARTWELRAALGLAHLLQAQGDRGAAKALLLPVYATFHDGFATADMDSARRLLETLAS